MMLYGGVLYMKTKFNDKTAIDMAYFRFSLIAPVVQGTFNEPTKTAYYRRVTESSFIVFDFIMIRPPLILGFSN